MRLIAKNIPVSLDAMLDANPKLFDREISHALGVKPTSISDVKIERKSVDARKKDNVHFVINLSFESKLDKPIDFWRQRAKRGVKLDVYSEPKAVSIPKIQPQQDTSASCRPVVVGAGPAGLFCALYLARAGMHPILIERGEAVEDRLASVELFNSGKSPLNPESNIQFGEGGAGTFSDGKLNTGTKSQFNRFVLEEFVKAGAPADILVDAKPHIGTDYLVKVVSNLRKSILDAGGDVLFSTKLVGIDLDSHRNICSVRVQAVDASGDVRTIPTDKVIVACGHSARDTFEMLHDLDVHMERKPFAVGVRIEHPQALINSIQYGKFAGHPALPPADYKLAVKSDSGRGVYTFCMCPGGEVVAAASDVGGVCVNGMSNYARNGDNANSAVLVEINPDDFDGDDVLAGVEFQKTLERAAYELGGGDYKAPVQRLGDFLGEKMPHSQCESHLQYESHSQHGSHLQHDSHSQHGSGQSLSGAKNAETQPTYPRGYTQADLHDCLPSLITDSLESGLIKMDKKMRGFAYPYANLTAVEARSSSPVRIVRDRENLQSINTAGLYPAGEGAGYAGGIMSAATDGLRVAKRIAEKTRLSSELPNAVDTLRSGGIAVFPTDTVCGIGVSAIHCSSVLQLYKAKNRPTNKPFQWLVADRSDVFKYGSDIQPYVEKLVDKFWPGALTVIVEASDGVRQNNVESDGVNTIGTIGLRMPDDHVALRLIRELGSPIIASSANRSGEEAVSQIADIDPQWLSSLSASVVHGFTSEKSSRAKGVASTVVDCTGEKPIILREGSITSDDIYSAI